MQTTPEMHLKNAYDTLRKDFFANEPFETFRETYLTEFMCGNTFLMSSSKLGKDTMKMFILNMMFYYNGEVPGYLVSARFISQVNMGQVAISDSYTRNFFPSSEGNVENALIDVLKFMALWRQVYLGVTLDQFSQYFKPPTTE